MDASPLPMIKAILPKVPLIGKTALLHTLGVSEHSKHWDLRTELTVNVLRSFLVDSPPSTISKIQRMTLKDPGIKGRIWISKVTMPKPKEDDIRQALFKAIEALKEPGAAAGGYQEAELLPVEAEWTGYRAGATKQSVELKITEHEKYTELMREVSSPVTVLYFHGGAYYLLDPASHRATTKKLAKLTKGRCFSVRYRLAPQNPFPAALLDALVSYFSLIYPPAGAYHEAVDPNHIVFAGDSAGGNLCLVLLQTLLEFRRQGIKVQWNGEAREIPVPAGLGMSSPWADITHSSPSCETNGTYDYLPARSAAGDAREIPEDDVWPANPPRRNLYAEDAVLWHPLVSPMAATSWEGSCPLYIQTGQELLSDEDKYVAARAAIQGVPVVYEEYEAMPHCFAMMLEGLPGSRKFFDSWAAFISQAVEKPHAVTTKGTKIRAKTLQEEPVDVTKLTTFTHEEVVNRMRARVQELSERKPDTMSKL